MILSKLKEHDLTLVAISGGAGVDPDGLACVEAMALIVKTINPEAVVDKFYNGKFDRPQNKTMRELLRLDQIAVTEQHMNDVKYTCVISVDGPASTSQIQPVDFVIDHHPESGDVRIASDVRMVGACSSIMFEYLDELEIPLIDYQELATALAIGICTDTKEKTTETTSTLDFNAEQYYSQYLDLKLYDAIKNFPKPHYYGDMYTEGWENKQIEGTCLVTQLGVIPSERTGVISDLAEKFSEFSGVSTCCVVAMVENYFDVSVRTTDTTLNVDEFCKSLGKGGGRRGAGRFRIELPSAFCDTQDLALFEAGYNILMHKILKFTGDGSRDTKRL